MTDSNTSDKQLETVYIKDVIGRCEDIESLKEAVLPLLKTQQNEWAHKINEIITEKGYSQKYFAQLCGVSRVAVSNWLKGSIPKSRDTFLRIGMAAGYSIDNMNQLLQRYGRYPGLYSKSSLEDCVCIFVCNHNYGEESKEKYEYILNRIKESIIRSDSDEITDNITTERFDSKLHMVKDEDELELFIADNIAVFSNAYHLLYSYIIKNIEDNLGNDGSVYEMSLLQNWSSSLRQCVSAIRQHKWYPTRNKIISLGLHLGMDHAEINLLLKYAHMEPLCAKNIFESIIMFVLDDASLNDMLNTDSDTYDIDDLYNYARDVLSTFELPEVDSFMNELLEVEDEF